MLFRDKGWPLRPAKTNRGPGTACYNSGITAAPPCSTTPLEQIGRHWHPKLAFFFLRRRILPRASCDMTFSAEGTFRRERRKCKKMKGIREEAGLLLFPDGRLYHSAICSKRNVAPPRSCAVRLFAPRLKMKVSSALIHRGEERITRYWPRRRYLISQFAPTLDFLKTKGDQCANIASISTRNNGLISDTRGNWVRFHETWKNAMLGILWKCRSLKQLPPTLSKSEQMHKILLSLLTADESLRKYLSMFEFVSLHWKHCSVS